MNKSDNPFESAFVSGTDHLSLWEVAHRWSNDHPDATVPEKLPPAVKDALFAMMRAQIDSQLCVVNQNGTVLKDWRYCSIDNYDPSRDTAAHLWDGSEDHRRELFADFMQAMLKPHDQLTRGHHPILRGEKPISRAYLESVHVNKDDLAKWAIAQSLPCPSFWFTPDEIQKLQQNLANVELDTSPTSAETLSIHNLLKDSPRDQEFLTRFVETEKQNMVVSEEIIKQLEALEPPPDSDAEFIEISNQTGRLSQADIDKFWGRLGANQQMRLFCRTIAKRLWDTSPSLNISHVAKHPKMQALWGIDSYTLKAVQEWISDLDPRPNTNKRGRPSNK